MSGRKKRPKLIFHERIEAIREEEGLTLERMAKQLHWSVSTLTNAGKDSSLSAESLSDLARTFGVNINWLLLGEGPARVPRYQIGLPQEEQKKDLPTHLELFSDLDALFTDAGNEQRWAGHITVPGNLVPDQANPPRVVRVSDASMHPILQRGWLVGVDTRPAALEKKEELAGKIVVVNLGDKNKRKPAFRWLEKTSDGWVIISEAMRRQGNVRPPAEDEPPDILGRVIWWLGKQD